MNYAWANPNNGLREQTPVLPDLSKMLAEAKRRVWIELQKELAPEGEFEDELGPIEANCSIWRQEPVGTVTVNGPHLDPARVVELESSAPGSSFAWCQPETGIRMVSEMFPGAELVDILKRLQSQNDPTSEVIVYATWLECVVNRSDPEPEAPPIPVFAPMSPSPFSSDGNEGPGRAGDSPDIQAQRAELDSVTAIDDGTKVGKVTAWALLDIASVLRESALEQRYPKSAPPANPAPRLGLWQRFWRFILGDPREGIAFTLPVRQCENCFAVLADPDGAICPKCAQMILDRMMAPAGFMSQQQADQWDAETAAKKQAERRAEAVASRGPAPVSPASPHVFLWGSTDKCDLCGRVEGDLIHGKH